MDKKKVIAIVLIVILLIASICIFAVGQEREKEMAQNLAKQNTEVEENVDNTPADVSKPITELANTVPPALTDEDLELTGDLYNAADAEDVDGNTVTIAPEEEMPMIILYWNTTEEPSMEALKSLQKHYKRYRDDVKFTAVTVLDNYEEERESVDKFIEENEIKVPIVFDSIDSSMSNANNVSNVPTLLVINKKGEVINTMISNITEDAIHANLDIITENY